MFHVSRSLLTILLTPGLLLAAALEDDFRAPPATAKPYVWWHWMGANISKEGVTKDLEAMKAAGIGGATIFNLSSGVRESQAPIGDLPWPERTYRSAYYWECLRHAASEAKRLGLEIGLHNTVGYSATGGPWISDDKGMMHVLWSETPAQGGMAVDLDLPQPKQRLKGGWGGLPKDAGTFFRDIAVVAVPVMGKDEAIPPERIIDLTTKMDASGRLNWADAPAGSWTIMRLGYGPTGATPHPVPDELIGLVREADKLSGETMRFHWSTVIDPIREHLGPLVGDSFRHLLIDSYEAGNLNWTAGFRETFQRRFGYDPVPWMASRCAALEGGKEALRIIASSDLTTRFERDLKTLVAEEFAAHQFGDGRELIHRAGLQFQVEPYHGPFDTVTGAYMVDLPMGEFWSHASGGISGGIVAGARAGGHHVIGAEAFTGTPRISPFSETPGMLQKGTVGAFVGGVNRLILHHWVHQPFADRFVPGQGMGWWGTHFGRNQTWFEGGKAWLAFAGRCQAMLQHGETWVSTLALGKAVGDSDAVPVSAFLGDATVDKGDVVLPSGRRYGVLILPADSAMEPEVLGKVRDLLAAGATVVGTAPDHSPSLAGYPACDATVKTLAADLWRTGAQPRLFSDLKAALASRGIVPDVTVVAGKVRTLHRTAPDAEIIYVANLEDGPQAASVSVAGDQRQPELWNPEDGSIAAAPVWRTAGGRTEVDLTVPALSARFIVLRAPGTATHVDAVAVTTGTATVVNTADGPALRAETPITATVTRSGATTTVSAAPAAAPATVAGPWSLAFTGPGTPGTTLTLPTLGSWTEQADPAVRYASGTGTYTVQVEVPAAWLAERGRVVLDLGEVKDLAAVRCNGTALATVWHPPFRVDLTPALKAGANILSIAVTNTWHNRLIGDEQEPEDCTWGEIKRLGKDEVGRPLTGFPAWFRDGSARPSSARKCFVTWNYMTKDRPLLPAGLIGPVRLVPVAETLIGK